MRVLFAFGGVSLIVILVLLLVAVIIGSLLYATAGVLWGRKTNPERDKIDDPEHGRVSDPPTALRPHEPPVQSADEVQAHRIFADESRQDSAR
jgi:hypothetical protein